MLNSGANLQRSALRILFLSDDVQAYSAARATLEQLPELDLAISQASLENATRLAADQSDIVMVFFNEEGDLAAEFLQRQTAASERPRQFALVADSSSSVVRRALRAGADEVLFLPLQSLEVTKALLKVSEARRQVEHISSGIMCAVAGLSGGVGVTTIVANLALALRYALERNVVAVDLDLQASDLTVRLNLEPEQTIVEAATATKLDSIQLENILSKHASGLYVLAAPKQIEESERVTVAGLNAIIALLREVFDFVIIDCGRHIDDRSIAVWENSDHLFYVVDQSISAMRCAGRLIDLLSRLKTSAPAPHMLLNRFIQQGLISSVQISETFGRPLFGQIPRDDKLFSLSNAQGKDIWQLASKSPVAKSFEHLAHKIAGGEQPIQEQRRFLMRLLPSKLFLKVENHESK
jgi:pilus assembly protein CpaE